MDITEEVYQKYTDDPRKIFNVDDTAFQLQLTAKSTYAEKGTKRVLGRQVGTSSIVTMVCCGSAAGDAVPPLFVFQGKSVSHDILKGAPSGSSVTTAENGKLTKETFFLWMRDCFLKYLGQRCIDDYVVLWLDGATFHIDLETIELAERSNVVMIQLPPGTSQDFQSLDVGVLGQ